jgi:N-acetylmuramate 1-kinase
MENRFDALKQWVDRTLGVADVAIRPVSSDASSRRYYRVSAGGRTLIAMDAPPAQEDIGRYIAIARGFRALGLNVPEVLALDVGQGFALLSDLGGQSYLAALEESTVERLYGDALGALIVLQAGTYTSGLGLPEYDESLLRRELEICREWYLGRYLGRALTSGQNAMLDEGFAVLARSALEQPRVWVHRDYHSRNLMVTAANNPGILDFQDAVQGPVTYDIVSLLRDCYITWPRARVEEWALGYFELAQQSGIPVGDDDVKFLRWFDLMGVQRHLKAAGIFARLHHRDGKPAYLKDIPRTLGYVAEVAARHSELAPLRAVFADLGIPGAS